MTNSDLAALSEAATQGEWLYRPLEHDDWGLIRGEEDDRWGWVSRPIIAQFRGRQDEEELNEHRRAGTDPWKANPLFVTALVNEYRAGKLLVIEDEADAVRRMRNGMRNAVLSLDAIASLEAATAALAALKGESA